MKLTTDLVRERLDYNPNTGVFIWRARGTPQWDNRFAGKVAGTVWTGSQGTQYLKIRLQGKSWHAHRLAFLWMGEAIPEQVDHKDRDGLNNSWDNLRRSCYSSNSLNRSKRVDNKSGVVGVSWHKATGKWCAKVVAKGVVHHCGLFAREDLDLAAMEVLETRMDCGFDPHHGCDIAPYHKRVAW